MEVAVLEIGLPRGPALLVELGYFDHGGILPYVIRNLSKE
ncbi:hypothetical protein ACB094_06G038000 [Castanea mollissima]